MNNEQKGILFTILTSLSLGLNFIFGKLIVDAINVETSNTIWFMFASIIFVVFFVSTGRRKNFKVILDRKKEIFIISILSVVGSIFWMYGLLYAGTNNMSFVFQFNVIFTVLLGVIFLKESFKKIEIAGIIIAIIGIFILSYNNSEISTLTILIILISALFNSLSNLVSKIFVRKINPLTMACGRGFFVFLLSFGYALITNRLQLSIPSVVFLYAFLGALTGAFLGFIFFYNALKKIKVSKVISLRAIEPFLVVIFSFIILSILPTKNQLIGGVLIIMGVIILILGRGD